MKKYAEKFYKSRQWQEAREAYAKSKAYLCEDCLRQGIVTPGEIVHHIRHITRANINDPAVTLNPANLRLLCRSCHERAHRRPAAPKRYTVDAQGHVTIAEEEKQTGGVG